MADSKLTAVKIEKALAKPAMLMLSDGGNLYVRRQRVEGTASWVFRYKLASKIRWLTLGNLPDMTLAQAREQARQQRVLIDQRKDPVTERRLQSDALRSQRSVEQLAEDWFKAEFGKGRVRHPGVPRRYIDNYIIPKLGRIPVSDVRPDDITRMLDELREPKPAACNDLLRYTQRMFSFARRRQMVVVSPAGDLTARLDGGGLEKARKRSLDRAELVTLFKTMRASKSFGGVNLAVSRLLLALAVRKNELFGARIAEFDLDTTTPVWRLPEERGKTGAAITIPLASTVAETLRALVALAGGSEYLLPRRRASRKTRQEHVGPDTLNAALAQLDHGLKPFTVHDWRRTARTHIAALGVAPHVAERILNHKVRGVQGVYDRHDYFDERRDALTRWAAVLDDIEHDRTNVVPIGAAKRAG